MVGFVGTCNCFSSRSRFLLYFYYGNGFVRFIVWTDIKMKIFGVLQYNGQAYWGFEKQKDYPSIQGKIEEILSSLLDHKIVIHGAGRTDKGVSARGQTFTFFSVKEIQDIERLRVALNRLLPKDIYVLSLKEVDSSFDARHSSCGKIYFYSILKEAHILPEICAKDERKWQRKHGHSRRRFLSTPSEKGDPIYRETFPIFQRSDLL